MVNIFNNGLVWCWTCLSEAIDQIKCLIRFTQTRKTNKSNLKYFPKPKNSNNRKNLKISKPEANETQTFRYKRQKVFESWSFFCPCPFTSSSLLMSLSPASSSSQQRGPKFGVMFAHDYLFFLGQKMGEEEKLSDSLFAFFCWVTSTRSRSLSALIRLLWHTFQR